MFMFRSALLRNAAAPASVSYTSLSEIEQAELSCPYVTSCLRERNAPDVEKVGEERCVVDLLTNQAQAAFRDGA